MAEFQPNFVGIIPVERDHSKLITLGHLARMGGTAAPPMENIAHFQSSESHPMWPLKVVTGSGEGFDGRYIFKTHC